MFASARAQAKFWLVTGFMLSAIAAVIGYFAEVSSPGYTFDSFRGFIAPLLSPLEMITAVFAWWWLSNIIAADERQLTLLKKGFYALALQYFLYCALVLVVLLLPIRSLGGVWITVDVWLQGIGGIVACLGFVLMSRSLEFHENIAESPPADVA